MVEIEGEVRTEVSQTRDTARRLVSALDRESRESPILALMNHLPLVALDSTQATQREVEMLG